MFCWKWPPDGGGGSLTDGFHTPVGSVPKRSCANGIPPMLGTDLAVSLTKARHSKILVAAELLIVYLALLLYIWKFQFRYPLSAAYILLFVLLTILVHRDSSSTLGMTHLMFWSATKAVLFPTLLLLGAQVVAGALLGSLQVPPLDSAGLHRLGRYFAWCLFQQFGVQSFLNNRLIFLVNNRRVSSLLLAVIFGSFHWPNPVLLPLTFLGGYFMADVFARHRNIIPLAAAQALLGSAVPSCFSRTLHHNLRVGPGYYWPL